LSKPRFATGRVNLRLRPVRLAETVATVVEEFRTEAEHKGLALVSSVVSTSTANTDADLLCVILRNLISNAVKLSERGTITISMSSDGHENRIAMRDEGVGIALEDQGRIFEPLERLESVEHKHTSGFGLGLATSKKLGEALGAHFEIKSEIGAGSTFTLIIP
jgi:signal transduction histidine kinase